jgi:aminotransferase
MPIDEPLDMEAVGSAFSSRTRAIIINSPNNPTGKVFTREELRSLADLCIRHDAYAVTDEIYEHILYEGEHIPIATLPGMAERTITISGASKTFSVTGWRIGTIVAPAEVTLAIRKVHDFLTVGAPAPLQEGVAAGLESLGEEYYRDLREAYRSRRDIMHRGLVDAGFRCGRPAGSYYILADFSELSHAPDDEFACWLTREIGVAVVPGSSFFDDPVRGRQLVRFAFCKTNDLLEEAVSRLAHVASHTPPG